MTDTLPANLSASVESPGRMMSVLKARCIARYQLHTVPGRPEELEENQGPLNPLTVDDRPSRTTPQTTVWNDPKHFLPGKIISFGYIHGSVRIRQHGGPTRREWVDHRDITFKEGWLSEVYDYLDRFFDYRGYPTPAQVARPIRDNPQA